MDHWVARLLHVLLTLGCAYGQDVFNTMPPPVNTSFTCRGRDTGFYADAETNCRVYHTCDDHGNKFTYYCPEETAFRQEALVCDHAHLVDCAKGRRVAQFDGFGDDNVDSGDANVENVRSVDVRRSSFGDGGSADDAGLDVFRSGNSNPAYTRSFRITAEPPSSSGFPSAPKSRDASKSRPSPTFVLNSSVYFRDRGVLGKADATKSRDNVDETSSVKSGVFAGKTTPTTTTLRPYRDDLESPGDFRYRFFDGKTKEGRKKDENRDGFSSGFVTFSTTFRPFGADFKVKHGDHTTDLRSSGADARNQGVGSFGGTAMTLKPFGAGFKVIEPIGKVARDFGYENSGKKDVDRSSATASTTFRPFGADFKSHPGGDLRGFGKVKLDSVVGREEFTGPGDKALRSEGKGRGEPKGRSDGGSGIEGHGGIIAKGNARSSSSFFFGNENFPYSETLRSMQAGKSALPASTTTTTSALVTTAGTEFPVHPFAGSLSPLVPNELEDDPYYPRRPTTTEAYYRWTDSDKGAKRPYRFSTRRPWPGSLDFEIPEVLPDLNTLDDLVDRRKLFFIPRVKAT